MRERGREGERKRVREGERKRGREGEREKERERGESHVLLKTEPLNAVYVRDSAEKNDY